MAFGGLKGTLTGSGASATNPSTLFGSVAIAIGDLIFVIFGEQVALTATGATDNLGNTYTAQNAGTLSGAACSGRAFWSVVTVAGTLTTVSIAATASTDDYATVAAVIEGPFVSSPVDANPANITADITSPFTCPATGALAQANEVVMAWIVSAVHSTACVATSPNLLAATASNSTTIRAALGYQAVSATTTVTPAFTAGSNPTSDVLGTASFKGLAPLTKVLFDPAAIPRLVRQTQIGRGPMFMVGAETPRAPVFGKQRTPPITSFAQYLGTPATLATPVEAAPFAQLDWSKTRTANSLPSAHQQTNINLFDNPIPFAQFDWSQPKRTPDFLPPSTFYNVNIFSEVPFAQLDWSQSKRTPDFLPPSTFYNVNIFSEVPFVQLDWSQSKRVPDFLVDVTLYNLNIYGAITAAPFAQYDWSAPRHAPDVLPPDAQPYNPNLYSAPFAQYDWPQSRRASGASPPVYSNANIFSEVPFAQEDWSSSSRRSFGSFTHPYNLALLGVVQAPFNQLIWTPTALLRVRAPEPPATNINVFTNPIPLTRFDTSFSHNVPNLPPPLPSRNQLLFSEVPFIPADWSTPIGIPRLAFFAQTYNLNIYATITSTPFFNDWSFARSASRFAEARQQTLNLALLNLNPIPFAQYDWSTTRQVPYVLPRVSTYNPLIFSEQPFSKLDWSSPRLVPSSPSPVQPYNTSLLTGVVQTPFNQLMWTAAALPRVRAAEIIQRNLGLFPNPIPFSNVDLSASKTIRRNVQTDVPNLNLYAATVPAPFIPVDWSKPFYPRTARVAPATSLNINIYTNPIPFSVFDYTKPSRMYLRPGYLPSVNHSLTFQFPFSQTNWPAPAPRRRTMPPLNLRNITLLSPINTAFPFSQLDWRTPSRRTITPPPQVVNVTLSDTFPPANIVVRVYGQADDRSLSSAEDIVYIAGSASGVSINGYPEPDARS